MNIAEWEDEGQRVAVVERIEDPQSGTLERLWDVEWKKNLADAALARVRAQVSPKQYQIFDCYVIRDWDANKGQDRLGVSLSQVYLAKHRVGKILKKELARLNEDAG